MKWLRLTREAREALTFLGGMAGIVYMMILGPIHPELIPVFTAMVLYKPAAIIDRKSQSSTTSPDTDRSIIDLTDRSEEDA